MEMRIREEVSKEMAQQIVEIEKEYKWASTLFIEYYKLLIFFFSKPSECVWWKRQDLSYMNPGQLTDQGQTVLPWQVLSRHINKAVKLFTWCILLPLNCINDFPSCLALLDSCSPQWLDNFLPFDHELPYAREQKPARYIFNSPLCLPFVELLIIFQITTP